MQGPCGLGSVHNVTIMLLHTAALCACGEDRGVVVVRNIEVSRAGAARHRKRAPYYNGVAHDRALRLWLV